MKKFPFWIIPFTLILFVVGVGSWLIYMGKLPLGFLEKSRNSGSFSSLVTSYQKTGSENIQSKIPVPSGDHFSEEKKEVLERKNSIRHFQDKPARKGKLLVRDFFRDGLIRFEKGDYEKSALNFLNFLAQPEEKDKEKMLKAKVYLGYSLLFLGVRTQKNELLEKSRDQFLELYREITARHDLYPRVILGLARSSRFLENYEEGMDIFIKESLVWAKRNIRSHLYLELGYFYFASGQIDQALSYFEKSNLPIGNRKFFDLLLEKEGTSVYLLTLFQKKMIPQKEYKELKIKIQQKILNEARRYFKEGRKEEAFFLLKRLIVDFPYDFVVEEANFYLGEFYFQDLQYPKALYFYDQVLTNHYLDYDAASLFKKGLIYYRTENYPQALQQFNAVRENFVSSQYYRPALDWIREIDRKNRKKAQIPSVSLKENEIEKPPKEKDSSSLNDDLFLKEEIPEEEMY